MRLLLALFALLVFTPARAAEWREAETAHFRIVSSGDEAALIKFAERLEAFHALLGLATGANEADRKIVKVRVFLVAGVGDVKRLIGRPNSDVAGYYTTREDGALAVVPRSTGDGIFTGQLVLFHEYAHHYMLQYTPAAYPSWYVEGFAEIASTASFERKGSITFGKAASHRQYELEGTSRYPTVKMIDGSYVKDREKGRGWSYGDAWLLTHYLTFSDKRRGQLRPYLVAINAGKPPAEAAQVFGDLTELQREVSVYLSARSFPFRAVPMPAGAAPPVVRVLSPAEVDLLEHDIELRRRTSLPTKDEEEEDGKQDDKKSEKEKVDFETRLANAKKARSEWLTEVNGVVKLHGGDPFAWAFLADAQCASEDFTACAAAADRALALAPDHQRATVRKAEALLALAKDLPDEARTAQVAAARELIAKANNANPDDPLPLLLRFRSYSVEGRATPPVAFNGLRSAVQLVPQQWGPRLTLASGLIAMGRLNEARYYLRPLAFSPHDSSAAARARAMLEQIDAREAEK